MWLLYFKKSLTSYYFLAICVASLFLFWRLGVLVVSNDLVSVNTSILIWIISHRIDFLTPFFLAMTSFGDIYIVGSITLIIFLFLVHKKVSYKIGVVLMSTFFAYAMAYLFKITTAIARPPMGIIVENSYSFPSGHATLATAFFISILFVLWPEIKESRRKIFFSGATILIILLVAFSRMYLGVHWASDSLGGILLGLSVATFCIYVYKKFVIMAQFDFSKKKENNATV